MKIEPAYQFKSYIDNDLVRIVNNKQSAFYARNGCIPKDIYTSTDRRTGDPIWVFIFSRKDTQSTGVYDAWCRRKQDEIDRGE